MATIRDNVKKPAGSPRFVPIAIGLAVVLILAAAGIFLYALRAGPRGVLANAVGGPFHLIDQNGRPFTDGNLKGKWHLVFFGYTHCPDECPTTLNNLSLVYHRLSKTQQKNVRIVFISVDPGRDTPAVMKAYVANFDAPIIGLTGTAAEVRQAATDYHVYYAKHVHPDGSYDMDHSTVVYVMSPNGRFVAPLGIEETVGAIEAKLEKLLS
jgi:protein SCO1